MPEIGDLKGHPIDTDVEVVLLISKSGDVIAARAVKGDPKLFERSKEAALKWHYKPYILNGYPIEADTIIQFHFAKNKVEVVVPPGP